MYVCVCEAFKMSFPGQMSKVAIWLSRMILMEESTRGRRKHFRDPHILHAKRVKPANSFRFCVANLEEIFRGNSSRTSGFEPQLPVEQTARIKLWNNQIEFSVRKRYIGEKFCWEKRKHCSKVLIVQSAEIKLFFIKLISSFFHFKPQNLKSTFSDD